MSVIERTKEIQSDHFDSVKYEPIPGFEAEIVPNTDSRIVDALGFESDVMRMLGDEGVKDDIAETFERSGIILINEVVGEKRVLAGAIRYMLPDQGTNKTFNDVAKDTNRPVEEIEALFIDQSAKCGRYVTPMCTDLGAVIDASALSPSLSNPERLESYSDALLAACRIVGNALFEEGLTTHVTGNLHGVFIGYGRKLGYPFQQLLSEDGGEITSFRGNRSDFFPVHTSLELYEKLMRTARIGSHLSLVRSCYDNLTTEDRHSIATAMSYPRSKLINL